MKRLALLLPLLALAAAGCASVPKKIQVLDEAGNPVEGAVVQWQEWEDGSPLDGCCFYGPGVHVAERATLTDETGWARLTPAMLRHQNVRVVLSPDLRRYLLPSEENGDVLSLKDFRDVDFSFVWFAPENCATVGPEEWTRLFDARFPHFVEPFSAKGSRIFDTWANLRKEALNPRYQSLIVDP